MTNGELREYWCDNGHPVLQYRGHAQNPRCPLCGKIMTTGRYFDLPGTEPNTGVRCGYLALPIAQWETVNAWFWRLEYETDPELQEEVSALLRAS